MTDNEIIRNIAQAIATYCKNVQKKAKLATVASNVLPKRGGEFEVANVDRKFQALVRNEIARVSKIMVDLSQAADLPNPTRLAKSANQEIGDQIDLLQIVNDKLFERVANSFDEAEGLRRHEHAVVLPDSKRQINVESWLKYKEEHRSKNNEGAPKTIKPTSANRPNLRSSFVDRALNANSKSLQFFSVDHSINKPQLNFAEFIDNSTDPFKSKLKFKHHALTNETTMPNRKEIEESKNVEQGIAIENEYMHPYANELRCYKPTGDELCPPEKTIFPRAIDLVEPIFVDDEKKLQEMIAYLNEQTEFAFDLEHHNEHSYLGLTCLIQISTRHRDYIVDPFTIWDKLSALNEPFTDRSILKVAHGANSDVLWLQRDFGIYIVNMFDTYCASRILEYPKKSLEYIVKHLCNITLNKLYRSSDWRLRPLPNELKLYAQNDTHYLLYCKDKLLQELYEKGAEKMIEEVLLTSRDVSMSIYTKPNTPFNAYQHVQSLLGHQKAAITKLGQREHYAARLLSKWRDNIARLEDESYHYVLPNNMLLAISNTLPRDLDGIISCCGPAGLPPLVRKNLNEVHALIINARDASDEKLDHLSTDILSEQIANTSADEHEALRTRRMEWLYSPHDFSNISINGKQRSVRTIANEDRRSFSMAASNADIGNVQKPIVISVYDEMSAKERARKFETNFQQSVYLVRPFEQYLLAIEKVTKMRSELELERRKLMEGKRKDRDEDEKRFSHHDPSTGKSIASVPLQDADEHIDRLATSAAESEAGPSLHENQILTKKGLKRKAKNIQAQSDMKRKTEQACITPFDYEKHLAEEKQKSKDYHHKTGQSPGKRKSINVKRKNKGLFNITGNKKK